MDVSERRGISGYALPGPPVLTGLDRTTPLDLPYTTPSSCKPGWSVVRPRQKRELEALTRQGSLALPVPTLGRESVSSVARHTRAHQELIIIGHEPEDACAWSPASALLEGNGHSPRSLQPFLLGTWALDHAFHEALSHGTPLALSPQQLNQSIQGTFLRIAAYAHLQTCHNYPFWISDTPLMT
jgi:hypothetical protein